MPPLAKNDMSDNMSTGISFDSADGHSRVAGVFYSAKNKEPHCILQVSHGMCEYMARYEDFARFLADKGIFLCGNDHLGHGDTAKNAKDLGYLSGKDGRRFAIQDLKTMNDHIHKRYPGLPVWLLGHSMGSFFARKFVTQWPTCIDGLILSGTGGPNPAVGVGVVLSDLMTKIGRGRRRSRLLYALTFGRYCQRIERPKTPYDWISRDEQIVSAYAADPKCHFLFTVNGMHELYCALREVNCPEWALAVPKQMPVLLVSGDADPVGKYGQGVTTVHTWLQEAGVKHLACKLYSGARHEVLNETNREEVYRDIFDFIENHQK